MNSHFYQALPEANLHTYAGLMQLVKAERQRLIESVVARKRVGTQFELLDALAEWGCAVTQATISRDIRELRLEKTHDPFGRPRYAEGIVRLLQPELANVTGDRRLRHRATPLGERVEQLE